MSSSKTCLVSSILFLFTCLMATRFPCVHKNRALKIKQHTDDKDNVEETKQRWEKGAAFCSSAFRCILGLFQSAAAQSYMSLWYVRIRKKESEVSQRHRLQESIAVATTVYTSCVSPCELYSFILSNNSKEKMMGVCLEADTFGFWQPNKNKHFISGVIFRCFVEAVCVWVSVSDLIIIWEAYQWLEWSMRRSSWSITSLFK